ncbi:MAG: DUF732 domain-containing protein [Mycobacterium sp.]|uniref:DUF732 domain-containing protein n=1 Tax=Mycobacterium sp. TaxID=1785 RepID=UPI003C3DA9EC
MKPLLALIGISMGIVFAVPAHAEPGLDESPTEENNETFLADLQKVGIGFGDPRQAISAGQAVCAHIHNGMSGLHLIKHLQENNPALTENGAAQFATISAKAYCPRQLDEAEEPGEKNLNKGASKGGN